MEHQARIHLMGILIQVINPRGDGKAELGELAGRLAIPSSRSA
jgi:hypothetical protein